MTNQQHSNRLRKLTVDTASGYDQVVVQSEERAMKVWQSSAVALVLLVGAVVANATTYTVFCLCGNAGDQRCA